MKSEKLTASDMLTLKNVIGLFHEPSLDVMTRLDAIENRVNKFIDSNIEKFDGENFDTEYKSDAFKEFTKDELVGMISGLPKLSRNDRKIIFKILESSSNDG